MNEDDEDFERQSQDAYEWIENVVRGFCSHHRLTIGLNSYFAERGA